MFDYADQLAALIRKSVATDAAGAAMSLDDAVRWAVRTAKAACAAGNKLMFIGNGGSAAIASHMAIDFSKNGGMRALAFNDAAALTCLSNDIGYEAVFSEFVGWHAGAGDLLIAISSSGKSQNILNGVAAARARGCRVLSLSGFAADNPLRRLGDLNVYVPCSAYGLVEITHLAVCHCILDTAMGLRQERQDAPAVA